MFSAPGLDKIKLVFIMFEAEYKKGPKKRPGYEGFKKTHTRRN